MISAGYLRSALAILGFLAISACGSDSGDVDQDGAAAPGANGVVNIYSGRHYDADIAIYDAFTKETGIEVNLIEAGGDALIERLAREKDASPADVFITADAGVLWRAETRGVLASIDDETLNAPRSRTVSSSGRTMVSVWRGARVLSFTIPIWDCRKALRDMKTSPTQPIADDLYTVFVKRL